MRLKVLLPRGLFADRKVSRIRAEAENGAFGLLEHHIDFVTALVPGILSFIDEDGNEVFLAVDEGILIKKGAEVQAAVGNAVSGPGLGHLRRTVENEFQKRSEQELKTRSALSRLEADIVRRFMERAR